jgi:hypothetical protein
MQVNVHNPTVTSIYTLSAVDEFHTIELRDRNDGELSIFVKGDWSDWDALVEAVGMYRAEQAASMNRKEMLEVVP